MIAALVVMLLTWVASSIVGKVSRRLLINAKLRGSLKLLISRISVIGVWIIGILIAVMIVFPALTPAEALGAMGIASVVIDFAFKNILENFLTGVLLLWRIPFENGDYTECEGILGKVEEVSIRMTEIRKTIDELVVLPNSFLFKSPVRILTNLDSRRITVGTGIAYDEDVQKAVEVIAEAVNGCSSVDKQHPVQIFPQVFGLSSIEIEVTWWCGGHTA